ncbi:TrbG/VirB9 family P-type conjugative transfer protein, partial [Burkholderia multivorans]|nr:TrbG/VirB9 family P-type conjugative transfer protein [Burkholderia multivorans]
MYQSASALARERGLGAAGCCGAAAAGVAFEVTALGVVAAAAVLAAGPDGEPVFRYHSASVDAARFAGVALAAGFEAGAGAWPAATVAGADQAKPTQVFDDGARIYVQFSDMKHVPAIFTETSSGRVLMSWELQFPYAVLTRPAQTLIFQLGPFEARAQRGATGATAAAAQAGTGGTPR